MAMSARGIQAITVILVITTIMSEKVKPQTMRHKREDRRPRLQEVIYALENLNYKGNISSVAQQNIWHATTKGEMLEYATPSADTPVTLAEAITKCRELDARIWDRIPEQGLGFEKIKLGQEYWISSMNSELARFNPRKSELQYDPVCTAVKIEQASEPGEEKKITIKNVVAMEAGKTGCRDPQFKYLTLCVRAIPDLPYANNRDYRENQKESKDLISEGYPLHKLKEVKNEWASTTWTDNPREDKMEEIMVTIEEDIKAIKDEDNKHFPDFANIKTKYNAIS